MIYARNDVHLLVGGACREIGFVAIGNARRCDLPPAWRLDRHGIGRSTGVCSRCFFFDRFAFDCDFEAERAATCLRLRLLLPSFARDVDFFATAFEGDFDGFAVFDERSFTTGGVSAMAAGAGAVSITTTASRSQRITGAFVSRMRVLCNG